MQRLSPETPRPGGRGPQSCDIIVAPCGCQAPSKKAPPASSALTQIKSFQLPKQLPPAQPLSQWPCGPQGEGWGQQRAPVWGLAFEIISCSLKGGQRGVWGSLEVKYRQPFSQLLASQPPFRAPVLSTGP